jgi:hypothetical protein
MSNDVPPADAAEPVATGSQTRQVVVEERVLERECSACGKVFRPTRRGRPAVYCSAGCRQRGWALRQAKQALGTAADRRPEVVREVVERVLQPERLVLVPVPAEPAGADEVPVRSRGWVQLLTQLVAQLDDPSSPVVREHWQHLRLFDALAAALAAVDRAHPGGLNELEGRRR